MDLHVSTPWQSVASAPRTDGRTDAHGVALGSVIVTDAYGHDHALVEVRSGEWYCKTHNTAA